jgi:hypothetical protein
MTKKYSQSNMMNFVLDNLYQLRLKDNFVNIKMADTLFNIWKEKGNKISKNMYRKPSNISSNELETLQKNGLIRFIGDRIEITDKGTTTIKTMILGDERSSFDDDKTTVDYKKALENIKPKKSSKKNEDDWWGRF